MTTLMKIPGQAPPAGSTQPVHGPWQRSPMTTSERKQTMRHGILNLLLIVGACVPAIAGAQTPAFTDVFEHYEAIRQILIEDSTEGIAEHASAIATTVATLQRSFNPSAAQVRPDDGNAVRSLLPEIEARAELVASAADLATVRAELAELTKPLVRWHELVEGSRPVVAYCPMEKKAWLQPDEAIGNPYAPYMLRCGEVVQR